LEEEFYGKLHGLTVVLFVRGRIGEIDVATVRLGRGRAGSGSVLVAEGSTNCAEVKCCDGVWVMQKICLNVVVWS